MIDFTFTSKRPTTMEEVNRIIAKYVGGDLKGIMGGYSEPLVSHDFNHNPLSSPSSPTKARRSSTAISSAS